MPPYRWDIIAAPLAEVANQEKLLPPDFISADGFSITEAARRYLGPLIVGEGWPTRLCEAPERGGSEKTDPGVRRLKTMTCRYSSAFRSPRARSRETCSASLLLTEGW